MTATLESSTPLLQESDQPREQEQHQHQHQHPAEHEQPTEPEAEADDPVSIRARAMAIVSECLSAAASGTTPLQSVKITNTITVDQVVYYEISVSVGSVRWSLTRRYAEFHALNALLEQRVRTVHTLPPFPARSSKYLVNHLSAHFISVRRSLLQNYLAKILTSSKLRGCSPFLSFLTPSQDHQVHGIDYKQPADALSPSSSTVSSIPPTHTHATFSNTSSSGSGSPQLLELDDDPQDGNAADPEIWASDEVTGVSIPAAQILKHDHVVYQINVENIHKRKSFARWTVLKRYQEFFDLDAVLRTTFALQPEILALIPDLPTRRLKLLIDHLEPRFIEERRIHLQVYLEELIKVPAFCQHDSLLSFLGCM